MKSTGHQDVLSSTYMFLGLHRVISWEHMLPSELDLALGRRADMMWGTTGAALMAYKELFASY